MRLTEIAFEGPQPIDSYGPGFFRVGGVVHHGNLALLPSGVNNWPGLGDVQLFLAAADNIDVVLLGMGADIAAAPPDLKLQFESAGIGLEVMSTPSACRTYNVLLSEGRRVAAALLPV